MVDFSATESKRFIANSDVEQRPTGSIYTNQKSQTVTPVSNSTAQVFLSKNEITYDSSYNIQTGGYVTAGLDVVNTLGTGTIDKIVGRLVQLNLMGGNVASAVGVESEISRVGSTTNVTTGYSAFYVPNMASVTNIANVPNMAALQSDQVGAHVTIKGAYRNANLVDIAPRLSFGKYLSGRFYAAEHSAVSTATLTAGVAYIVPYMFNKRQTLAGKIGLKLTAITSGNIRFFVYSLLPDIDNCTLLYDSGSVAQSVADVEANIAILVEAGPHIIGCINSADCTAEVHVPDVVSRSYFMGQTASGTTGVQTITANSGYIALPATLNTSVMNFNTTAAEPHIYYKPT